MVFTASLPPHHDRMTSCFRSGESNQILNLFGYIDA